MPEALDISEIAVRAAQFQKKLDSVKAAIKPNFDWYPYDSLAGFTHLDRLLTGVNRRLLGSHSGGAVLDIGCSDGLISFFLESLGYRVTAIDHPVFNHNGMRGIRALKQALGSSVEILERDLDRQFEIPGEGYEITFLLGTLYHLQNPLYVLETVARRSRHCFASTRIARKFPGGRPIPDDLPVAYLLDDRELNDDNSNFFIFSDRGLRVALRRTQWDVLDYLSVGDRLNSDPVSLDHDERVYCLLKSRWGLGNIELLSGWHEPEGAGWRWTERVFAARIESPGGRTRTVKLSGYVPPELLRSGPVPLRVECNGAALRPVHIEQDGDFEYAAPASAELGDTLRLRFELGRALPADAADPRERGLIVASISAG